MDEATWAKRPDYARRSMAATRAVSKACRLAFSWVMVMAGYDATPREEAPYEAEEVTPAVTRDTHWPGPGPTYNKSVREWKTAHLKMAADGLVKVPDEWLAVVKAELADRPAGGKTDRGAEALKERLGGTKGSGGAVAGAPAPVGDTPSPAAVTPDAPKEPARRKKDKGELPF